MPSTRKTFVVSVRDREGPATIQEVRTGRTVRLQSLSEIKAQIERWLRDARSPSRPPSPDRSHPDRGAP